MSLSPFSTEHVPEALKSARWIWAANPNWDLYNCYAQFRKELVLSTKPTSARLWITADQSYQLYVNGAYICRGPARGFQAHWPYDEVDLSPFLAAGRNVIAIRAYHPGVSNFLYISQGFAGILFALEYDGNTLVSDGSWKSRRQAGIQRGTVPSTLQLFPQEHLDARLEDPDWMQPGYSDADWRGAGGAYPWNSMPWASLEPRGIPLLEEVGVYPVALLGKQSGRNAADHAVSRDVVKLRATEGFAFVPAEGAASPLEVSPAGEGGFASYLIDFGRTTVGCLEVLLEGAAGGEIIDAAYTETISDPLVPDFAIDTHCRLALGTRLICRPGRNGHRFYHPFGFRYLVLTIRNSTVPLTLDYKIQRLGYPFQTLGGFSSSDPNLEAIWKTCEWTQRCCSLDAYVDTPWREQAQWWGDARVQGANSFHVYGDARLFRRGIHCIASQTSADGVTYGHSPTVAHECVLPDFTLIWMVTLWDYYWQTGSTEPFTTHRSTIETALDYFEKQTSDKTGLLGYDNRYWLFLDWCEIFKDGYPAVYSFWYLHALDKLTALARLTGVIALEKRANALAAGVRQALLRLVDLKGLCHDGITWEGEIVPTASAHAQALAIITNLVPEKTQEMIEARLLPLMRGKEFQTMPSAYWITYVYSILTDHGYANEVIPHIEEKWMPMVAHGTTWEGFNPARGQESFSHAWSAHPLFHLMRTIGGIRQTSPAWKTIDFVPIFHGEYGGAKIPAPGGLIESKWKREGSSISVELSLPPGIEARVILPGMDPAPASGINRWVV